MAFNGYLSKFSLPELFQFLEEGYKTGLLTLTPSSNELEQKKQNSYIWFQQGQIIAAANSLDNRCLARAIVKRGWVNIETISKLFNISNNHTLGLCLKSQGVLQAEQLNLLFRNQITSQVSPLFQLLDAQFEFNFQASLPKAEMTGLSIPASEATLTGLRALTDWSSLEKKIPEISSILKSTIIGEPKYRLERLENQVLQHLDGKTSLQNIATQLDISQRKIQQVAFRLIVSNLVEEVFGIYSGIRDVEIETIDHIHKAIDLELDNFNDIPSQNQLLPEKPARDMILAGRNAQNNTTELPSAKPAISKSFLDSLAGFLKSKVTD
ncbi:DUF4388 domain-containing protein [Calothrix sp. PCC 6303]|uniref:DUF4388 domain-containing protein n=1 Tax=Calothrix sp. PCC 6303 TaxID=1170562 RepID=UPI0002A00E18|nr:DUF4388 domain-containing protein [Calothrix sp. PCC 6303]AFZ00032.1 hypothetical protein Cal6303_0967 [Calothrix sp. PCC 6303]